MKIVLLCVLHSKGFQTTKCPKLCLAATFCFPESIYCQVQKVDNNTRNNTSRITLTDCFPLPDGIIDQIDKIDGIMLWARSAKFLVDNVTDSSIFFNTRESTFKMVPFLVAAEGDVDKWDTSMLNWALIHSELIIEHRPQRYEELERWHAKSHKNS